MSDQTATPNLAHPLIFSGGVLKIYAVNRQLICSAKGDEKNQEALSLCTSRIEKRCPEKDERNCGSYFYKDCDAKAFIEEEISDAEYAKLFALFDMADQKRGVPWNREKFRDLKDVDHRGKSFLEFKPTKQLRLGCFFERDYKLYLTHGFYKQSDSWPSGEIRRLKNIYDDYLKVNEQIAGTRRIK